MQVFSYTCPSCDEHSHKVQARQTADGYSVQCPECGSVEEIQGNGQRRSRREVLAR